MRCYDCRCEKSKSIFLGAKACLKIEKIQLGSKKVLVRKRPRSCSKKMPEKFALESEVRKKKFGLRICKILNTSSKQ